jgi:hypothetical protein
VRTPLRPASYLIVVLGIFAFWWGILVAERFYPTEFDWRYMTLSTLLSPRRNSEGYLWAAGGVVLSGVFMLCWAVAMIRSWRRGIITEYRPLGLWLLGAESLCMTCSVMLPWSLPKLPKEHEILTLFAFLGLCLGMICLGFQTAERFLRPRTSGSARCLGLWRATLPGVAVLPIFLAGVAEGYVFYVLPQLHWVNLAWRARGVPTYLSFAFWEWITCAVLSIYLTILSLAIHVASTSRFPDQKSTQMAANDSRRPDLVQFASVGVNLTSPPAAQRKTWTS